MSNMNKINININNPKKQNQKGQRAEDRTLKYNQIYLSEK